ncbi:MAG: T9SS type A sorting domain-containing protein [Bacteroidales bacterium]|nr:T9SS type A sorting domain-containing protein [Bacteroidales bacterium]
MDYKRLSVLLALLISCYAKSQYVQGDWRDHLSYKDSYRIAEAGNIIYSAAQSGLLSYNKETGEVRKHSKIHGLSDVEVSTIAYSNDFHKLIIGYKNGNIDIVESDGSLNNISDIKRKTITGEKDIRFIYIVSSKAYLACGFGIVLLDIDKEEIKDTYLFGDGGTQLKVNDIVLHNDRLYTATEYGIYSANINDPNLNLVDYNYWIKNTSIPEWNSEYKQVDVFNNQIFAVYNSTIDSMDKIIIIENDSYSEWTRDYDNVINDISVTQGFLGISGSIRALVYDEYENLVVQREFFNIMHTFVDSEQDIYTAGTSAGFNRIEPSQNVKFEVNGPKYRESNKVEVLGDHVWVTSGGPYNLYKHGAAYSFIDDLWESYTSSQIHTTNPLGNTHRIAIDPRDYNHVYAGAYEYGIIEFLDGEVVNIFELDFEIFQDVPENVDLRIVDLEFDSRNNLWILLDQVSQPLYLLNSDGSWSHPEVTNSLMNDSRMRYCDLLITTANQIWICTGYDGIIILESDGADGFEETTFAAKNQENTVLTRLFCLDEDREGNIWVGSNSGPLIYSSPSNIFNISDVTGYQVKIPRNDGTNNADFLLFSEAILDIKIDGANRKWMATENSGVFFVSENGDETYLNFREENSPLLTNTVSGIGINEKSGDVFFASGLGVVSYKGSAITGLDKFTDVYVYPNPVRPNYNGIITITGLVYNTIVKITDISGNLVYETRSLGGQAIWDGKNFDGHRVATGIYFVLLATEDGGQTHITKIAFIH